MALTEGDSTLESRKSNIYPDAGSEEAVVAKGVALWSFVLGISGQMILITYYATGSTSSWDVVAHSVHFYVDFHVTMVGSSKPRNKYQGAFWF